MDDAGFVNELKAIAKIQRSSAPELRPVSGIQDQTFQKRM